MRKARGNQLTDVLRDQPCTQPLGFEGPMLGVQGAHCGALRIVQYRSTDGAGHMVQRIFRGTARVEDRIEIIQPRHHL